MRYNKYNYSLEEKGEAETSTEDNSASLENSKISLISDDDKKDAKINSFETSTTGVEKSTFSEEIGPKDFEKNYSPNEVKFLSPALIITDYKNSESDQDYAANNEFLNQTIKKFNPLAVSCFLYDDEAKEANNQESDSEEGDKNSVVTFCVHSDTDSNYSEPEEQDEQTYEISDFPVFNEWFAREEKIFEEDEKNYQ